MGNSSPGRVGVIRAAQFAAAAAFVLWPAPGWAQSKVEAEFTPAIAQKIAARPAPATVTTEDASALSAKGYVQIGTIRAEEPGNEARWATQELESAILKKAGEVGGDVVYFTQSAAPTKVTISEPKYFRGCAIYADSVNRTNCVKWDSISPIYDGTKTKSVKGFASEGTVWRNEPQLISAVARAAKIEKFMILVWRRDLAGIGAALNEDPSLINAKDAKYGDTALGLAAGYGSKDVVELLLAKGADVNARDNSGYTPMFSAEANKHKDVVKLLRQHGGVSCGAVRNCE